MVLLVVMAAGLGPVARLLVKGLVADVGEVVDVVAAPRGDSEDQATSTQEFEKAVQ